MTALSRLPSGFRDKTLHPGQGHGWLAHEFAVLTLVVFGRLNEEFEDGVQECASWELHYKPHGAVHTTGTGPEGTRMLMWLLDESDLERLGIPADAAPRVFESGVCSARALSAFLGLGRSGAARSRERRDMESLLWREIARRLPGSSERTSERPRWIEEVHRRVRSEDGRRTSVKKLASDVGVHPVYLARAYRRHYGSSISSARRRARIDRAVRDLAGGDVGLSDLALYLGYSDQSHFSREFKRETGLPPGLFRGASARLSRLDGR